MQMFHVTLEGFAYRALENGLDHRLFPGQQHYAPADRPKGNYLWGSRVQAEAFRTQMTAEHGGRWALLAVDVEGLKLHPDPFYERQPPLELLAFGGCATPHQAWYTPAPVAACRLTLAS